MDSRPQPSTERRLLSLPPRILFRVLSYVAVCKRSMSNLALASRECWHLARSYQFADTLIAGSDVGMATGNDGGAETGEAAPASWNVSSAKSPLVRRLLVEILVGLSAGRKLPRGYRGLEPGDELRLLRDLARGLGLAPSALRRAISNVQGVPDVACTSAHLLRSLGPIAGGTDERLLLGPHIRRLTLRAVPDFGWATVALGVPWVMPNLESLAVCDQLRHRLDAEFFLALARRPGLRSLTLSSVRVAYECSRNPSFASLALPLRRLELADVHHEVLVTDVAAEMEQLAKPFYQGLVAGSRATLEHVEWTGRDAYYRYIMISMLPIALDTAGLGFPQLRTLKLRSITLDVSLVVAFLRSPLRNLVLRCQAVGGPIECPPLPDIESVEIGEQGYGGGGGLLILVGDILASPTLRTIKIGRSEATWLDFRSLPTLGDGRHAHLRSLSVSWADPDEARWDNGIEQPCDSELSGGLTVHESSLGQIGTLTALEQVSLSVGLDDFHYRRGRWLVDHDAIRRCFGGLSRLHTLVILQDTYVQRSSRHAERPERPGHPGHPEETSIASDNGWCGGYSEPAITLSDAETMALWRHRPELEPPEDQYPWSRGLQDPPGVEPEGGLTGWERWMRGHRNRMLDEAERYAAVLPSLRLIVCGKWLMRIERGSGNGGTPRAVPCGRSMLDKQAGAHLSDMFGVNE